MKMDSPTYLDKLKKKREQAKEAKKNKLEAEDARKREGELTGAIVQQAARTRTHTQPVTIKGGAATSKDVDKLVGAVGDIIISQRAENSRLSESFDDLFDDLLEAIENIQMPSTPIKMQDGNVVSLPDNSGVTKKLDRVITAIKEIKLPDNSPIVEKLKTVETAIKSIKPVDRTNEVISKLDTLKPNDRTDEIVATLKDLKQAIKAIKVDPVVNVPKSETNVDMKPVVDAVNSLKVSFDLDNYMAQDLDSQDAFEYVGLVRPDGAWYIIENDVEGNTLRYKFGKNNYKKAWKGHGSLDYKLINEAYNETSA